MRYIHLCTVWRLMGGENALGGARKDIEPVPDMDAQPCIYSTEKVMSQSDESAESLQTERAFIFVPLDTDIQKGDVIKAVRFKDGTLYKESDYQVETVVKKASVITGPSHLKAELTEIA